MDKQLEMLKEMTDCNAPAGFEGNMTKLMERHMNESGAEIVMDNTGSVFGMKKGAGRHSVMLLGHLDEIGFMVTSITDKGFLKFTNLGYWTTHVMTSQKVSVMTDSGLIRGVIGGKPPHVMNPDERTKASQMDDMFIDIGTMSKEETIAAGVQVGDPVVPYSEFEVMTNSNMLLAKAWDNRFGCAAAIDVLKQYNNSEITLYSGAVTQEETLSRGAKTAANKVNPSIAIALDVCFDNATPGMAQHGNATMGKGPVIILSDAWHIGHIHLRKYIKDIAEKHNIPLQFDHLTGGYTDAGHVAQSNHGIPAVTMCVPTRYIHSNVSVMNLEDYNHAVTLLNKVTESLTDDIIDIIILQEY